MKKILYTILILPLFSIGQTPTGYTKINSRYDWLAGKMDSGFHVPSYNGTPNVRVGVWSGAGNVGVDSTNDLFYFYSNGAWHTSSGGLRFGVEDTRATQQRRFSGANSYDLRLDSLTFYVRGVNGAGSTISAYTDNQMFFNSRKGSFRAGQGSTGQYNDASVGSYTGAFGANVTVTGDYAFGAGTSNLVSGTAATSFGNDNESTGSRSFTIGQGNKAPGYVSFGGGDSTIAGAHYSATLGYMTVTHSYGGLSIGVLNDSSYYANPTSYDASAPALQIGNGTGMGASRSNALTVLFDGRTTIGPLSTDATALLRLNSTTQGFLPPRMTATQGSAIASPTEGLIIYVTNTNGTFASKGWYGYNGASWEKLNN